jgi:hypothetical protein
MRPQTDRGRPRRCVSHLCPDRGQTGHMLTCCFRQRGLIPRDQCRLVSKRCCAYAPTYDCPEHLPFPTTGFTGTRTRCLLARWILAVRGTSAVRAEGMVEAMCSHHGATTYERDRAHHSMRRKPLAYQAAPQQPSPNPISTSTGALP